MVQQINQLLAAAAEEFIEVNWHAQILATCDGGATIEDQSFFTFCIARASQVWHKQRNKPHESSNFRPTIRAGTSGFSTAAFLKVLRLLREQAGCASVGARGHLRPTGLPQAAAPD
jgi:hypothetical protein